jgi:hypothetical protein
MFVSVLPHGSWHNHILWQALFMVALGLYSVNDSCSQFLHIPCEALSALGFKKVDNKSAARNGDGGPGKDLVQLIMKFCRTGETLIVQDKELKASIEKKIVSICCL